MTHEIFGEVISVYTRKQAIEDGVLIDLTPVAQAFGFKLHTVCTVGVMSHLTDYLNAHPGTPEDQVRVLLLAVRAAIEGQFPKHEYDDEDRKYFPLYGTTMYAHCGPGDEAEPVLTIMLEGED